MDSNYLIRSQEELDLKLKTPHSCIEIGFGTKNQPAIVKNYEIGKLGVVFVCENVFVEIYGKVNVTAFDGYTIAHDEVAVEGRQNAIIDAREKSIVIARENCIVIARGESHVLGCDSCSVLALENSSISTRERNAKSKRFLGGSYTELYDRENFGDYRKQRNIWRTHVMKALEIFLTNDPSA